MSKANIDRIEALTAELTGLIALFKKSLEQDEIFEVRKKIQLRMKELQKQINELNIADPLEN